MSGFYYKKGRMFCEDIPVETLCDKYGTPLYVYSYEEMRSAYNSLSSAFKDANIFYSVKANTNISIIKEFGKFGAGADVLSGGELYKCIRAGIHKSKIMFSGVGKKEEEIEYAIKEDIFCLNIESEDEYETILKIANRIKKIIQVSFRVNLNIDSKTHHYISTGLKKNKFGLIPSIAISLYKRSIQEKFIKPVAIHCHIGSQITQTEPFEEAAKKMSLIVKKLFSIGINITHIDIGGGFGIPYKKDDKIPDIRHFAYKIKKWLDPLNLKLIIEPGRYLIGRAGALVGKCLYVKRTESKNFIITDVGMNDLIRPALYDAYHEILPVNNMYKKKIKADIVGPVCESADFIAIERLVPSFKKGDLFLVMNTGAYGFTMSSNYNSRLRCAEVLVKGKEDFIIRERESYNDLFAKEILI